MHRISQINPDTMPYSDDNISDEENLLEELQNVEMNFTINILLFGESGCGKSKTVNAIANYCAFPSFEAAEKGEFLSPIPFQFDDDRENLEPGQSLTQHVKGYEFQFGDKRIRLIDTPGMGDTSGVEADEKNFRKILAFLQKNSSNPAHSKLSAICFLIKTITTRKTAVFQYCLKQLLSNLNEQAYSNIVFCFTFSRNSFYGPADGFVTVKQFLRDNFGGKIQLQVGVNCFFIDNEAYQYFVAKKLNYEFPDQIRDTYMESWNKSVENIQKMIEQIPHLKPFGVNQVFPKTKKKYPAPQPPTQNNQNPVQLRQNPIPRFQPIIVGKEAKPLNRHSKSRKSQSYNLESMEPKPNPMNAVTLYDPEYAKKRKGCVIL